MTSKDTLLAEAQPPPILAWENGVSNGEPFAPPPGKANILLVDDRPDKLLAVDAILATLNQNIVKARSGKEALRLLLQQDFALILLDVSMPGMDGFETASLIRQRSKSEHTPIIFITSIGNTENQISKGYSLGAVDYMLTPIIPEILRTKVTVFVELHRQAEISRRHSEEVDRLNHELEQRVMELTDANQELESFNYSIAHDLRAPLRSMSGFANALVEDEAVNLTALGMDYARRIARSASYMDKLLLDMLAYSRFARSEMPPLAISLEDIIQETLAVLDGEISQRNAKVEVISPLGSVFAHPPSLRQILSNLIVNSLKFAPPDRAPLVRVSASHLPGFVRLWVEDNGIGIAPQHHEKIFRLFQRLHHNDAYPGTGVGLALVRKGAERMGGHAGVESQLGQGSRFWVDLPASERIENG